MDGHTLIVMAAVVISCGFLCAAVRKKRASEMLSAQAHEGPLSSDMPDIAAMELPDDEGIISKRVIGLNPQYTSEKLLKKPTEQQDRLIIFHIMAKSGETFAGYELYQTLLDAGFTHNEYGVFEFIEKIDGHGGVSLFSVGSANEPGTFNINEIGQSACPGLSVFMHLYQPHVVHAFKTMLEKIEYLSEVLHAKVFDDQYRVCTQIYFDECRARVAVAYDALLQEDALA